MKSIAPDLAARLDPFALIVFPQLLVKKPNLRELVIRGYSTKQCSTQPLYEFVG